MNSTGIHRAAGLLAVAAALVFGLVSAAGAAIPGVPGPTINLTARDGYISTGDGGSVYMWGYANADGPMQYPGPTLILSEGQAVTVNLTNRLRVPVSIVFPEQDVVPSGGVAGLLTREAPPGATVTYRFTAARPGTFAYHSGTRPDLQVEMGLTGAIVVRPLTNPLKQAYRSDESSFDHEYLFLLSEIDPAIHEAVERGDPGQVDTAKFFAGYWFINGRTAPDTMADADVPWLPTQPYNCMPMTHPGEKILLRMVGAGRDLHPLHTHGNHHRVIARNGRLLTTSSDPEVATTPADLSSENFTASVIPGQTQDALFSWTGEKLGWDAYGPIASCIDADNDGYADGDPDMTCHDATCFDAVNNETGLPGGDGFDDASYEYCADHGKALPVILPTQKELAFGPWFSGSPFIGSSSALPPGEGGFNPNSGFFFMWHSHNEKEITNFDIFPGGMLTMMVVEHFSVDLMNP